MKEKLALTYLGVLSGSIILTIIILMFAVMGLWALIPLIIAALYAWALVEVVN